ncbi:MAG: RluA family pseudouridine synthase [Longicatena sp.]
MREFIIQENDANQRVDKFITKTMKTMPKNLMYKYIRNKKIKVNRSRCEISQRLVVGDSVQCYIAEEFFEQEIKQNFLELPSSLDILFEDENLLIVNKPSGLLAHSDVREVQDNLADRVLHYLYLKKEYDCASQLSFCPALCHRIDRNTQGIVIAAKNAEALREMNEKIRLREVKKKYLCIVEGKLPKKSELLTLYHMKLAGNKADIRKEPKDGYQEIKTAYKVLEERSHHSLLEIDLLTGKSHQIRAVMAYLKHPLVGDVKYGARKDAQTTYQALCAYKVSFHFRDVQGLLGYLNGRTIELENVDVVKRFHSL